MFRVTEMRREVTGKKDKLKVLWYYVQIYSEHRRFSEKGRPCKQISSLPSGSIHSRQSALISAAHQIKESGGVSGTPSQHDG